MCASSRVIVIQAWYCKPIQMYVCYLLLFNTVNQELWTCKRIPECYQFHTIKICKLSPFGYFKIGLCKVSSVLVYPLGRVVLTRHMDRLSHNKSNLYSDNFPIWNCLNYFTSVNAVMLTTDMKRRLNTRTLYLTLWLSSTNNTYVSTHYILSKDFPSV